MISEPPDKKVKKTKIKLFMGKKLENAYTKLESSVNHVFRSLGQIRN